MKMNDYQKMSSRTASDNIGELPNYGLGIAGEAGEVADFIKKVFFHGHEYDEDQIKKELGDVLWYLSQIARLMGLSLEEVATANIDKLHKRYPNGFSSVASINRVD